MVSQTEALRVIAQRTGVPLRAVTRYAGLVDAMLAGSEAGRGDEGDERPVTARWLVLIILAIAVGDADGLTRKLALMEEARLATIFISHKATDDGTEEGCITTIEQMVDLREHGVNGSRLTQLPEQFTVGTPGPFVETFEKYFGWFRDMRVTWSDGLPSIRLKPSKESGKFWSLTKEFCYEVPRAPAAANAGGSPAAAAAAAAPRNSRPMATHSKMPSEMLTEAHGSRRPATVH